MLLHVQCTMYTHPNPFVDNEYKRGIKKPLHTYTNTIVALLTAATIATAAVKYLKNRREIFTNNKKNLLKKCKKSI